MCRLWAYRLGFKSRNQLSWIILWIEFYKNYTDREDVEFARIIWSSN